jgi:peroxiredoxin Q/BCP|tara:strand:+ start:312 stop:449 length:138 start_codon:yes stop_codon:yes gene_type:complete
MPLLKEGDLAPPFALPNQDGIPVGLENFLGHRLLLWWYPKADTPG